MIVHHLFTTSPEARSRAVSAGYSPDGIMCYTPVAAPSAPDAIPFYRYRVDNDHIYTVEPRDISIGSLGPIISNGYYEGIACHLYTSPGPERSPLYALHRSWQPDHFYTPSQTECRAAFGSSYVLETTPGYVLTTEADTRELLYRGYNASTGDHLYTTSSYEIGSAQGYTPEYPPYADLPTIFVPKAATDVIPVYQLTNSQSGAPLYTTSKDEVNRLIKSPTTTLLFDGVAFHLFSTPQANGDAERVPVYQLMSPAHEAQIFTISHEERDRAMSELGFLDQGILGYAMRTAAPGTKPLFRCARAARRLLIDARLATPPRRAQASRWLLTTERRYPDEARFSKAPGEALGEARDRGYREALIAEGAPLLDRDLNLLGDLASARLHEAIERCIGNGVVRTDAHGSKGFMIKGVSEDPSNAANDRDFVISAGSFLLGGVMIDCPADLRYRAQTPPEGQAPLATWSAPPEARWGEERERVDLVYLDVFVVEQSGSDNAADLGALTTTLSVPGWVVRVAEGGSLPPELHGHRYCPLAAILLPTRGELRGHVSDEQIEDLRVHLRGLHEIQARVTEIQSAARPSFEEINDSYFSYGTTPIVTRGVTFSVSGKRAHVGKVSATTDGCMSPIVHQGKGWFKAGYEITIPPPVEPGKRTITISNGFGSDSRDLNVSTIGPQVENFSPPILSPHPRGDSFVVVGKDMDLTRAVRFVRTDNQQHFYITRNVVATTEKVRVYYGDMDRASYQVYLMMTTSELLLPPTFLVQDP